ncbi:MAG: trypsin-like peptidase domain-containing protein, partial [Cyanobacteria bacterium]|nr:trypsin-like peptidase domain-containing protein [Cyanobacteriota bacterium]
ANVMVKGKGGLGSGTWLQDANGNLFILTNHHVVEDNSIRGEDSPPTFEIRLHNGLDTKEGTKVEGQLIKLANGKYAESAEHDLALIGISTPNFKLPGHIKPMKLRDMKANPLKAGEFVIVVGSPRGLTDNVTHGIISHVDRKLEGFEEANVFVGVDAPINPGNSGGSCYDMQGRYIGPPTAGIRGADGMGFAIRTDIVKQQLSDWGVTLP